MSELFLLSDGLSGGGGECGSFLMGTRLGMGGGALPEEDVADIEGWREG